VFYRMSAMQSMEVRRMVNHRAQLKVNRFTWLYKALCAEMHLPDDLQHISEHRLLSARYRAGPAAFPNHQGSGAVRCRKYIPKVVEQRPRAVWPNETRDSRFSPGRGRGLGCRPGLWSQPPRAAQPTVDEPPL